MPQRAVAKPQSDALLRSMAPDLPEHHVAIGQSGDQLVMTIINRTPVARRLRTGAFDGPEVTVGFCIAKPEVAEFNEQQTPKLQSTGELACHSFEVLEPYQVVATVPDLVSKGAMAEDRHAE